MRTSAAQQVVSELLLPLSFAALAAALTVSYGSPIAELVRRWSTDGDYSHGYFVPLVSLAMLIMRRGAIPGGTCNGSWWGFVWIGASVGIRWVGEYFYYPLLHPVSLLPALAGLVLLIGGGRLLRWSAPAIGFLVFMIPLPSFLQQAVSLPLQRTATVLSSLLLQAVGQPAVAQGNLILIEGFRLEVVQACSGLRLLMTLTALVVAYTLLIERPWREKLLLLLGAAPIAIAANVVRLAVTGFLYRSTSSEAAQRAAHDGAGLIMIPVTVLLLVLFSWYLQQLFAPQRVKSRERALVPYGAFPVFWNWRLLSVTGVALALGLCTLAGLVVLQRWRLAARYEQAAQTLAAQQQWPQAVAQLAYRAQLLPGDPQAHLQLVRMATQTSEIEPRQRLKYLRRAIQFRPGDPELRRRHLKLLLETGDASQVEHHARLLLAVRPDDSVALRALALARYGRLGIDPRLEPEAVLADLTGALEANPADPSLEAKLFVLTRLLPGGASSRGTTHIAEAIQPTALGAAHVYEALEIAVRVSQLQPGELEQLLQLAELWLLAEDHRRAALQFEQALRLAPDDVRPYMGLATCHVRLGEEEIARETLQQLFRAVELSEQKRNWMIAQGLHLVGRDAPAHDYFLRALAASPENDLLASQAATVFLAADKARAEELLRAALRVAPRSRAVRVALAMSLVARGEAKGREEALQIAQRAADEEMHEPSAQRILAMVYAADPEPHSRRRAIALLEQIDGSAERGITAERGSSSERGGAYEKGGRTAENVRLLARLYTAVGDVDAARRCYESLLGRARPALSDAIAYAVFLQQHPQVPYDGAQAGLIDALERYPRQRRLLSEVGSLLLQRNQPLQAASFYQRVLEVEPRDPATTSKLALALSQVPEKRPQALQLIQEACREDAGENLLLRGALGLVLLRSGNKEQAIDILEDATAKGEEPHHWLYLALAYRIAGRAQQAREALHQAGGTSANLTPQERKLISQIES